MEGLGTEMIAGVEAHGHRTTQTIPAGQIGNDRPIVVVSENWLAPGFDFPLREIRDDPRREKRVAEVTSLSLAEPDPSSFQPPRDMKTVT